MNALVKAPYEVRLNGPLDADTVTGLRPELDALVDAAWSPVTLNLSEVEFLDSSGVGAIIFLYKRLTLQGRTLKLIAVHGQPLSLLRYLRIDVAVPVSAES